MSLLLLFLSLVSLGCYQLLWFKILGNCWLLWLWILGEHPSFPRWTPSFLWTLSNLGKLLVDDRSCLLICCLPFSLLPVHWSPFFYSSSTWVDVFACQELI